MHYLIIIFLFHLGVLVAQETTISTSSKAVEPLNQTSTRAELSSKLLLEQKQSSLSAKSTTTGPGTDLANQASLEKLPHVSAAILRTKLQQEKDPSQRHQIALRLAEILLQEQRPAEALSILESKDIDSPQEGEQDTMVLFWKAQALLALQRPAEAIALLEKLVLIFHSNLTPELSTQQTQDYLEASQMSLVRAYRAQSDFAKAISVLDTITPNGPMAALVLQERIATLLALQKNSDVEQLFKTISPQTLSKQPRLAYLFALCAAQQGDNTEALKRFSKVEAVDPWTSSAAISGIVHCDISLNKPAEAQLILEKYLQENPESPRVAELMTQLEQLYILQNNNDITLFQKWSQDTTQPWRASYALLPYARTMERLGHRDKADELCTIFLTTYPHHALNNEALLELAQSKLLQGDPQGALSYIGDRPDMASSMRARYAFQRGLAESALKHPEQAKKAFIEAASFDPHLSEDALYNQSLLQITPDIENSMTPLKNAHDQNAHENEEYLAVLSTDQGTRQSAISVIKASRHFLETYPQSPFSNEVRMKLGEALLAFGNVREARLELETVGKLEPSSELGRQALFLAAQAASRSMDPKSIDDALMLLEQIAQSPHAGADVWQARLDQAALKNAQALPLEAIAIYDQILASQEPSPQLRNTAHMAKGDTLYGLGTKDRANYQAAINVWRQLADEPNIAPYWRNQALCKIGLTDEKLGDVDSALTAYYEALKTPLNQETELLWHDKSAFEAARLLESRKQWSEAIRLYQQIVSEGGPRAYEAQEKVSKLRLENFLWEK
ncbi:MAG: tetratricopeptide repeat protein [Verrucomicrobia bacterium]|nr:MAG: tetratricopeptide repeat protein [Verrucomicrobiota bacterium]